MDKAFAVDTSLGLAALLSQRAVWEDAKALVAVVVVEEIVVFSVGNPLAVVVEAVFVSGGQPLVELVEALFVVGQSHR